MRCFIIAVRYGYISVRIQILTSKIVDDSYIGRDLLLRAWVNFNPQFLDIEYESALFRN